MRRSLGPVLLISLGLLLVALFFVLRKTPDDAPVVDEDARPQPPLATSISVTNGPARTPQPIVPTATAVAGDDAVPATAEPSPQPTPSATPDPRRCPTPDCLARSGVSGRLADISAAANARLPFGNYFDWWLTGTPPLSGNLPQYWQMVPVTQDGPGVPWSMIEEVVSARPGSIWIVGNEPDVAWQDNTTAAAYAAIYHDVYTFIKERDPAAKIAVAGVAQPSPLRFAYLEQILATYQARYGKPMPVDIWTVHAFILREQAGSWGIGIPPGMDEEEGLLYEIDDHDDLEIFRQSLVSFRSWMRDHGYGDKPLAVTEFGILHPADYGFPPEVVMAFMIDAMEFMATASGETGDPEDGYHLVQYWFWYSVYDGRDFPTGNLYEPELERLTAAGQAYRRYLDGR